MKRREFISLFGGAALAFPITARAQTVKKISRIGVLWPNPPATFEFMRQGLKERGYVEGQNISFEFRWAQGQLDRLSEIDGRACHPEMDGEAFESAGSSVLAQLNIAADFAGYSLGAVIAGRSPAISLQCTTGRNPSRRPEVSSLEVLDGTRSKDEV